MLTFMDSLFEEASTEDFRLTKKLLSKYKRAKVIITDYETNKGTRHQEEVYQQAKAAAQQIERAVKLILDDEVRRIIEFRYIEGHSHKLTVLRFNGAMGDRTVDRKLIEGILSVSNTLKLWGELSTKNDSKTAET